MEEGPGKEEAGRGWIGGVRCQAGLLEAPSHDTSHIFTLSSSQ